MKADVLRLLPPFQRLLYWITEREHIRVQKDRGVPPPWTDDPVLQTYRFCNVRRMDDRVSRWLYKNWYVPHRGHPNMLLAAALARHFNLPDALEAVGFPTSWEPERIKQVLRDRKAAGQRIFNGAYMVRGIGTADKTEMVVDHVCAPLVANPPPINTSSMEQSVAALLPYWGFSSFMAGQVVADLRWAVSGTWKDKYTWAPIGPGSLRGMNRLLGKPITAVLKQPEFLVRLTEMMDKCKQKLAPSITGRLEAMDYQNCLCEFDKNERALWGEGKPKQRYQRGGV